MKKIYLFAVLATALQLSAQTPLNTFNKRTIFKYWDPEDLSSLQQTTDRGYISARMAYDSVGGNALRYFDFVKRDREGNTKWIKRALMGNYSYINMMPASSDAIQTNEGGYLGAMMVYKDSTHGQVVLIKTDSAMNVTWSKKYPGELASSPMRVHQCSDNGYIVCGYTKDMSGTDYAFVFKTDAAGNYAWGNKCIVPGDVAALFYQAIELPNQGFVVCGSSGKHALLVKFDLAGNMVWNKTFFYQGGAFYTVAQASDKSLMVGGGYADSLISGQRRLCLLKMDTTGTVQWFKGYNQTPNPYYGSNLLCLTPLQGYVAYTGYMSDPIPGTLIGKMDLNGNFKWTKKYISTFHTFNYNQASLVATTDGGYAMDQFVGTFLNGNSNFSKELLKIDSVGNGACDGASHPITMAPLGFLPLNNAVVSNSGSALPYSTTLVDGLFTDSIVCETINDHVPVGITELNNVNSLRLYPNPATDVIHVDDIRDPFTAVIHNLLGETVMQTFCRTGTAEIDIRALSPGIYMLEAQGRHYRFIKE